MREGRLLKGARYNGTKGKIGRLPTQDHREAGDDSNLMENIRE